MKRCALYSALFVVLMFINIVVSAQVIPQQVEKITIVDDDIVSTEDQVEGVDFDKIDYVEVEPEVDKVFEIVDEQPEFPGGDTALMGFIRKNIKYPDYAKMYEIEGRVIVSFIVERDGSIGDIKIAKTLLVALDEEAKRIVSIMPDWKPGKKDGKPVRVKYSLPINFRLDEIVEEPMPEDNQDKRIERLSFKSLVSVISGNNRELLTPQVVNDPDDEANVCLLLTYKAAPKAKTDTQLLLYCNKPFVIGDTIFLSLRVKGKAKQDFTTEIHSTPGIRLLSPSWNYKIDDNWAQYSLKYIISDHSNQTIVRGAQTIVINVADLIEGNVCYFDDMRIEAHHLFFEKSVIEQPEFPGGLQAIKEYFSVNNKYPSPGRGKGVYLDVSFHLESDGTIHNPHCESWLDSLINIEAIRLVSEMPIWIPRKVNGEPSDAKVTIPIEFDNSMVSGERQNRVDEVYYVVEEQPEFPGGSEALLAFLRENIKYPSICRENGIQGRVLVGFTVEEDGSISDIEVVKSVNPLIDKEAIRVISIMPNWKPGQLSGKPVRVHYTVPITFRLN